MDYMRIYLKIKQNVRDVDKGNKSGCTTEVRIMKSRNQHTVMVLGGGGLSMKTTFRKNSRALWGTSLCEDAEQRKWIGPHGSPKVCSPGRVSLQESHLSGFLLTKRQ